MSITPLLYEQPARFFIAATPRSRTCWLANFMDAGPVSCRHELLSEADHLHALHENLDALPGACAGTVDTLLPMFAEQVRSAFPSARWAILERPALQVARSLLALGIPDAEAIAVRADLALREMEENFPDAMLVPYHRMNDAGVMRELWEHCAPDCDFPAERFTALRDIQVQIHPAKFAGWLQARTPRIAMLMHSELTPA